MRIQKIVQCFWYLNTLAGTERGEKREWRVEQVSIIIIF